MNDIETNNQELFARVLVALDTPDEALAFMRELCTPQELRILSQRTGIAELLMQGFSQQMINEMMCDGTEGRRPSTATINRVSAAIKDGDGHLCKMIARANGVEGS